MPPRGPTAMNTLFAALLASAVAFAQTGPCRVIVNVTDNLWQPE